MSPELRNVSVQLQKWMRAALKAWRVGWEASGSWVEERGLDGRPHTEVVRRHRVQARQVYTYALATRQGWHEGRDVVRGTVDFLWEAGWARDGAPGLIHQLNPDGSVADARRDFYDHAFYLLALGWAEATVGGQMERLERVWAFIASLALPQTGYGGGYAEGVPPALPRRQNPHMHLFEACLNLDMLGIDGPWRARAGEVIALFETRFYDPRHKAVTEFFEANWTPLPEPLEPGHAMEWVWLLGVWERLTGEGRSERDALYQNAILSGGVWLWDETDRDWEAVRETSRLWVQTELVKAHLTQAERDVAGALDMAVAGVEGLLAGWLRPDGLFVDKIGACGQRLSAAVPTSTLYHIATMVSEVERVAEC